MEHKTFLTEGTIFFKHLIRLKIVNYRPVHLQPKNVLMSSKVMLATICNNMSSIHSNCSK